MYIYLSIAEERTINQTLMSQGSSDAHLQQISDLEAKLSTANVELLEVTHHNQALNQEMFTLQEEYDELQNSLGMDVEEY